MVCLLLLFFSFTKHEVTQRKDLSNDPWWTYISILGLSFKRLLQGEVRGALEKK